MKALLLTALLAGLSFTAQAQQLPVSKGAMARTEEYCQVQARHKLNGKVVVSIDYGQQQKFFSNNLFRDADGKPVEFNSEVDALNWLNSQGWEFVGAHAQVNDGDSVSNYVMRRRIAS